MKFSTALIGLFGLFAPSIKADGNLFDQDQDPSAIAGLIEWDDDVVKRDSDHQRIIGGDYTEPGSRPWLVPVVGKYFCGGSLISPSAVMTAGIRRNISTSTDGAGGVTLASRACTSRIGASVMDNDVAIIFLPKPVTDIVPLQLNEKSKLPKAEETLDVASWGRLDAKKPYLNYAPAAVNLTYVGDNEVCTHKPIIAATCKGDSGGPLNLLGPNGEPSNTQVGIVSWGVLGCYHQSLPSVFTRVSEVADWAKETECTQKGELCKGGSKAAKAQVMKRKYPDTCVPVGIDAPTMHPTDYSTFYPTVSPRPTTKTLSPTTPWPTYFSTTYSPTGKIVHKLGLLLHTR
ncbi:hypothetical protein ACHAWO_003316 [Cyclotella atomus]|uniref:Peptidase S1 domain-containing protein n=1 Tax=Cyclotella atomus TaxID=382360 RepID=A0ABD3N4M1_9STRA